MGVDPKAFAVSGIQNLNVLAKKAGERVSQVVKFFLAENL